MTGGADEKACNVVDGEMIREREKKKSQENQHHLATTKN